MPALNWLNRDAAFWTADAVPGRLLEHVQKVLAGEQENLALRQIPSDLAAS